MIEANIFLLMFVWPFGQAEGHPLWQSDAFLTFAECEKGAVKRKAEALVKYGPDTRIEHYCFDAADQIDK